MQPGKEGNVLIPTPDGPLQQITIYEGANSLWATSQLTREQFRDFENLVKRSAQKFLDCTKTITFQNPHDLKCHYQKVARLWDLCSLYEDNWLVKRYTGQYLRNSTGLYQRKQKTHKKDQRRKKVLTLVQSEQASGLLHSAPKSIGTECTRRIQTDLDTAIPMAHSSQREESFLTSVETVRRTLRSSQPPVPRNVIDSLIDLGINDMERLRDLAKCPAKDWKPWMDCHVDFDPWGLWTLKRALAKLAPDE